MMRKLGHWNFLLSRQVFISVRDLDKTRLRHLNSGCICHTKLSSQDKVNVEKKKLLRDFSRYEDSTIVYSSKVSPVKVRFKRIKENQQKIKEFEKIREKAIPLIVENLVQQKSEISESDVFDDHEENVPISLPYARIEEVNVKDLKLVQNNNEGSSSTNDSVQEEISKRLEVYEEIITSNQTKTRSVSHEQMSSSKNARKENWDAIFQDIREEGTCDPDIPISKVPCGGCGAMLHCQDHALPGFITKEYFEYLKPGELKSVICRRCHFLKHHDVALNVRVSPDMYQKILEPIKEKKGLVVIVVDLLDVPCSIWPNLIDIVGTRRPVIVVGNKIDLLPADDRNHLKRVKESLVAAIDNTSLGTANIKFVTLVSAHTGYGIEPLITKIQNSWGAKDDIYIVGCTNSGKSTLFNALLGSDLCKTKASDLVQRSTTSPWPGTTLNMLKFPLLRPSGYRLYCRTKRLKEEQSKKKVYDKTMEFTSDTAKATLTGHIGRTFITEETIPKLDAFSINAQKLPGSSAKYTGINESLSMYAAGKWCYDTPGTVQPDQMINLLTHEELMKVLPRELIVPRTYSIKTGITLFIGGLARLDLLYCPEPVRMTVFSAADIPVTIVKTVDASAFYRNYLGTPFLGVPLGSEERLRKWPALEPHNIRMTSEDKKLGCGDIVLSSAGWITITAARNLDIEVRGWTPGGRGIYLRNPPMLPFIASLKGSRIDRSPAFKPHKLLIPRVAESVL